MKSPEELQAVVEHHYPAKATAAWLGVGVGSSNFDWASVAAMLAAVYTMLLILEWIWKKVITPLRSKYGDATLDVVTTTVGKLALLLDALKTVFSKLIPRRPPK